MQPSPLSYSLLTLAIAAASLSARAETYQIDNGPKSWENVVIAEGLSIGGELTTAADALTLKPGTRVLGDLIVDATIETTGAESSQDRYSRPLALGQEMVAFQDNVRVEGDLINRGNLIANGLSANGIYGRNLSIGGTLSNTGLISVRDTYVLNAQDRLVGDAMPAGISLMSTTRLGSLSNGGRIEVNSADIARGIELVGTPLAGSLENTRSGSVEVTGDEVHAIAVNFNSNLAELINEGTVRATGIKSRDDARNLSEANGITVGDSIVRGRLLNSGNIIVSGYEATGIDLITYSSNGDPARVNGDLVNSGRIDVSAVAEPGATARAIEIANATVGGALNNSGIIIARGTDSAAIHVDGGHIAGDLFNSGTIQGGRYGIYLRNLQPGENLPAHAPYTLIHQNAGTLEGGEYALYADPASTEARLIWAGGSVKGNIHGSTYIDVIGDAVFDGTRISGFGYGGSDAGGIDLFNADDSPLGRAASLTLVQPHVTIDGHLEMNRGTVLQLNLSQATDPQTAIVKVRSDAYFAPGSSIALRPTSEDFRATGREYKVIEAGVVEYEGTDQLVVSSSALLNIDSVAISDTQVRATVSTKSDEQAGTLIEAAGASANARRAFQPFYASVMGQLDNDDAVFQAFANADQAQLAALGEQLVPPVDGAMQAAANAVQNLVSGAVSSRTSSLRGASSGSASSGSGLWIQGHDSDLRQGRRSGIAGYDADSRGLSLGLDGKLNEQWTLGVVYSNLDTNVSGRTGNKGEIDSQVLTLYSGFEQGPIFVDSSLSYGFNDNTSKRDIAGTRAKGEFDSRSLALNLEAGYGLHAGGVTLEPLVATRYSRLDIDSYREKGSSAALAVSSQRYETLQLGAGARLAGAIALGQGSLEPELKLMAYHDFAAERASSTSSFVLGGSSFVSHGASPARDSYEASLGANYRLGALTLGAGYEHVGRSSFDADTLRAKVRYDF